MKRVLVTGSRDWTDDQAIAAGLQHAMECLGMLEDYTLVSGACPTGADAIAENLAERMGWTVERHPADWKLHGKRAGYVRNSEMVKSGIDFCLAFIKDKSKGATMTAELAHAEDIETVVLVPTLRGDS